MKDDLKSLRAVVSRIEGKIVILELPDKLQLLWPKKYLPKNIKSGNLINIVISKDIKAEKKQKEKIRNLQYKLLKK